VSRPRAAAAPGPSAENGGLRLGRYRSIWAAPEVEISPALRFTIARQQLEISPEDATRLGIDSGAEVVVAQLDSTGAAADSEREPGSGSRGGGKPVGTRLKATAAVRSGVPKGTAFLADGIATDSANALTASLVEVVKP
jgi:NADH-quinone oxidoreductase subunit G